MTQPCSSSLVELYVLEAELAMRSLSQYKYPRVGWWSLLGLSSVVAGRNESSYSPPEDINIQTMSHSWRSNIQQQVRGFAGNREHLCICARLQFVFADSPHASHASSLDIQRARNIQLVGIL